MNENLQSISLILRFWNKVIISDPEECWNWTAGTQSQGYGSFGIAPGKIALAHRLAYELENGEIPDGMCVMHTCDNRLCCNPAHLKLGTRADNNKDMISKHRHAFGIRNGNAVLTDLDVINMRSDYRDGDCMLRNLSTKYGVHKETIRSVVEGKSWKHLPLVD